MRMYQFILLVLLLHVASVYAQIPTFGVDAVLDNTSGNVQYLIKLKLAIPPSSSPDTEASFVLDANANVITLSSNCTTKTKKVDLWGFLAGDGAPTASASDTLIANLDLSCSKRNIAGFGSKSTSLPVQVSKASSLKLPLRFGYRLFDTGGTLFIGKTVWVQFISIVPEVKEEISFVNIPMKLDDPNSGYLVKLTGVGYKSFLIRQKDYVEISTTQRFTTLPRKLYNFVLGQFQHEAEEKKIAGAGSGYGKLNRCYKMSSSDVKKFRNVTMVFSSKFRWSVPAEKYLLPKPKSSNVFCFGYVEAAPGTRGVIGTLQQEGHAIEYNLEQKTFRVSLLPVTGALFSP